MSAKKISKGSKVVSIQAHKGTALELGAAGAAAVASTTPAGVPTEPPRKRGRPRLGQAVARDLTRDEEILRIAAEVVWKKGLAGAKLGDIAEAAGIVKGSLYHYFDSKEEIYERLIRNVRGALDFEAEVKGNAPAAERLRHLVHTRLSTTVEYPLEVALLVRELIHLKGPVGDWAREDPKKYFNAVRQILLQGQKEGTFRVLDPDLIASVIVGIFAHLPMWYRRGGRISPDDLVNELTDYVLAGVLKEPTKAIRVKSVAKPR